MAVLKSVPNEASSSTVFRFTYDVFLSFRGADTRKNFTDHLYTTLLQEGLRVFRDDDTIERGESLQPELEKGIKQSAISVIVFSENFADSRWCLDEVLTILDHWRSSKHEVIPHEVIPIFYKVEPTDVRGQKKSYAKAFYKHYDQADTDTDPERKMEGLEKVKAWRAALREVSSLTGLVLGERHEAQFIRKIVCTVKKKLHRKALYPAEHLVGIDGTMEKINSWIQDKSENTCMLIIHGIGGIGKTAVAKLLFILNYKDFGGSCFLGEIREKSKSSKGLLMLQSQLLSTLVKGRNEEKIWNIFEGTMKVEEAICNKKVLIVLDDVTSVDQINVLLGSKRFYSGSKIVITTRHKGLLNDLGDCNNKGRSIEIGYLSHDESTELLSWYAFGQDHPLEAYIKQSKALVFHCGGLPLALKVIGSSLRNKNVDIWEAALRKLEEIPNPEIHNTLQISYDSLEDNADRRLFLHLACFFNGYDKDYIVKILDRCGLHPLIGIQNLIDRCLLVVQGNNTVMMHQLIQEMGKEIVRRESRENPGERSRLCEHKDSFYVLKEKTGTKQVEGLILDMEMLNEDISVESTNNAYHQEESWFQKLPLVSHVSNLITSFKHGNQDELKIDSFERMDNLMLLQLNYVRLSGSYMKLPRRLRWLCWHGFPSKWIPSGIPLEKLVALDMRYSKLVHVWKGFKLIPSLKILDLSYSKELVGTPDFRGLPSLDSLILKGCVSLVEVCASVKDLKDLVLLDLEDCISLTHIPHLPSSIQTLELSNCPLQSSSALRAEGVKCFASLPRSLVTLTLRGCSLSDTCFPKDWSGLVSLVRLDLSENPITVLPNCVQSLSSLKDLIVNQCSQMRCVSNVPSTVEILDLLENKSLEEVIVGPSVRYKFFNIWSCYKLQEVRGCFKLASIKNVDKKIKRFLGLDSIHVGAISSNPDDGQNFPSTRKVLYEFGIFCTYIAGHELPSCFMYIAKGRDMAFKIPSHPRKRKIYGFNLCFTCSGARDPGYILMLMVEIHNATRGIKWVYIPSTIYDTKEETCFVWLSLWKCGDFLHIGDEVSVHIRGEWSTGYGVNSCSLNLIYNEDKNDKGSGEGDAFPHLSWTDKLFVEVSDYCNNGSNYLFFSDNFRYHTDLQGESLRVRLVCRWDWTGRDWTIHKICVWYMEQKIVMSNIFVCYIGQIIKQSDEKTNILFVLFSV